MSVVLLIIYEEASQLIQRIPFAAADPQCSEGADVAYMLDISDVSPFNYGLGKDFVKRTMTKLANKSSKVKAAVVLYHHEATVQLNFTKTFDLVDFLHSMDNLPPVDPCMVSLARIDSVLQVTLNRVFSTEEDRNKPKIAVLITQGVPPFLLERFPLKDVSESLKERGVRILALGIGLNGATQQELQNITEDRDDLTLANGFTSLGDFEDILVTKICSAASKFT